MFTTCRRRPGRFPGGGQYRVEIPGTGIMLQADAEIERMVKLGAKTCGWGANPARWAPPIAAAPTFGA